MFLISKHGALSVLNGESCFIHAVSVHSSEQRNVASEFKRDTKFLSMKGVTSKAARADSSVTWAHAPVLIGAELSAVLIKQKYAPP